MSVCRHVCVRCVCGKCVCVCVCGRRKRCVDFYMSHTEILTAKCTAKYQMKNVSKCTNTNWPHFIIWIDGETEREIEESNEQSFPG